MSATTTDQLLEEWFGARAADEELMPGVTVGEFRQLLTPPAAPPGSRWLPSVAYGTAGRGGRELVLDLYAAERGERRAGIVFIHGGSWSGGHRFMLVRQAGEMAAAGYVTATIAYRLSGEARWPAALEDAKCAVRFLRAHADEIGLDPDRVAVAGGSAGAHLAAMVALAPGRFEGEGGWDDVSSAVHALVLFNPVLDLRKAARDEVNRKSIEAFLGREGAEDEASPITYVTADCPPVLTRVGDRDVVHPPASCEAFHRLLDAAGVPNRLEIVPGMPHGLPIHDHDGCVRSMAPFLAEHLVRA